MQPITNILPGLVVHADWGSTPNKRMMTVAEWEGSSYTVHTPELVGSLDTLIPRLLARARDRKLIMGFDFPIGLPAAYAQRVGIENFLMTLPQFGTGMWKRFYDLAEAVVDISMYRPFYPLRPGGTAQAHLIQALGVDTIDQLRRTCERSQRLRNAACPLFWTLGANQVGRAAIIGWRDVLVPAMADDKLDIAFWPFQGDLGQLVSDHTCVVVETYPAEGCLHAGLTPPGRGWKKSLQKDREKQAETLLEWIADRPLHLTQPLAGLLLKGFGALAEGEDRFDSMVGLLSMIEVIVGGRGEGAPQDEIIRNVEGWILGQNDDR